MIRNVDQMRRTVSALVALLLTGAVAFGQTQAARALAEFSKTPGLHHAQWGFVAMDVVSGKILASREAHGSLAPASTMKTLTTGAALALLGPNYRVSTRLAFEGALGADGVLDGNLWLLGEGDPTLGSDRFGPTTGAEAVLQHWVKAIKAKGIRSVNGDILAWSGHFEEPHVPDGWQWADLANYFGAPVSGLSWRENFYKVTFKTEAPGTPARILSVDPPLEGYNFVNRVKAAAAGSPDLAYIYAGPREGQRLIKGSLPAGRAAYSIKGAFPDPALQCAQELRSALAQHGITVTGKAQSVNGFSPKAVVARADLEGKTLIVEVKSPTVREIVDQTNRFSLNLYAETLTRWIAVHAGKPADTDTGCKLVADFWKSQGIPGEGMVIVDGSGLSPGNGITPLQLTQVQQVLFKNPTLASAYLSSLSVMGESGTLEFMGRGTRAEGNIHAKSGTLTRVICYTGYVTVPGRKPAAFAIMVNKYSGSFSAMKKAIEKLMVALAD